MGTGTTHLKRVQVHPQLLAWKTIDYPPEPNPLSYVEDESIDSVDIHLPESTFPPP